MKDTNIHKLHSYVQKLLNIEIKDLAHKANKVEAYKMWIKEEK
jgi:hypothetical protein